MALTGTVQELLLCVLCYDSGLAGRLLSHLVPNQAFEGYFGHLASKLLKYYDTYGKAPGDHTLDLIEELILESSGDEEVYRRIYDSLQDSKDLEYNEKYLLDQATEFVRQQRLKRALRRSVEILQRDEESLDEVENLLYSTIRTSLPLVNTGLVLNEESIVGRVMKYISIPSLPTGIQYLDRRCLGPSRGCLHLFLAGYGKGKSWWLIHLGKQALLHRYKVVHITLEMSEEQVAQRYLQMLFSISKRPEVGLVRQAFTCDARGSFLGMTSVNIGDRLSFADEDAEAQILKRVRRLRKESGLVIKKYPTASLTMSGIRSCLDSLEVHNKLIPDLLIVDYPDLMSVNASNRRSELGQIYMELRGLADERNIAVAVGTQINREGIQSKRVTGATVSEDISKMQTADIAITYSQTDEEKRLGLARLFVDKGRNEEDKFTILISQNYKVGQFCLDSAFMVSRYWESLKSSSSGG